MENRGRENQVTREPKIRPVERLSEWRLVAHAQQALCRGNGGGGERRWFIRLAALAFRGAALCHHGERLAAFGTTYIGAMPTHVVVARYTYICCIAGGTMLRYMLATERRWHGCSADTHRCYGDGVVVGHGYGECQEGGEITRDMATPRYGRYGYTGCHITVIVGICCLLWSFNGPYIQSTEDDRMRINRLPTGAFALPSSTNNI